MDWIFSKVAENGNAQVKWFTLVKCIYLQLITLLVTALLMVMEIVFIILPCMPQPNALCCTSADCHTGWLSFTNVFLACYHFLCELMVHNWNHALCSQCLFSPSGPASIQELGKKAFKYAAPASSNDFQKNLSEFVTMSKILPILKEFLKLWPAWFCSVGCFLVLSVYVMQPLFFHAAVLVESLL